MMVFAVDALRWVCSEGWPVAAAVQVEEDRGMGVEFVAGQVEEGRGMVVGPAGAGRNTATCCG